MRVEDENNAGHFLEATRIPRDNHGFFVASIGASGSSVVESSTGFSSDWSVSVSVIDISVKITSEGG